MENYQEFTKPRHTATDKIQSKVLPQGWCSATIYLWDRCGMLKVVGRGRDMFGDWQDRRYGIWVRLSWAPHYVNWYVDKYSQGAKIIFVWCATIVCINFWPHLHFECTRRRSVFKIKSPWWKSVDLQNLRKRRTLEPSFQMFRSTTNSAHSQEKYFYIECSNRN